MTQGSPEGDRAARITRAVYEFLRRRENGETLSVGEFAADHADLLPELTASIEAGLRRLKLVREVQRDKPLSAVELPPAEQLPGQYIPRIRGYQITRRISSGGQGAVFQAVQELTGRTVAIKVVLGVSRNSAARFEREVQALASIDHPGVIKVVDRGRTLDDTFYLVMDYVEGDDLDGWIASLEPGGASRKRILTLFKEIAAALESAHAKGIVHRDLKPSNVRIAKIDRPYLIDFGLAQLTGGNVSAEFEHRDLTHTGDIVGSVPWASPEQAIGSREITPASDVYSLGVLLYHALVGQFPYPVDGPLHKTTYHICHTPAVIPRSQGDLPFGRIDKSLSEIVLKCLAKDANDRFETAGELAQALADQMAGLYRPAKNHEPIRFPVLLIMVSIIIALSAWKLWPESASQYDAAIINLPRWTNYLGMTFIQVPSGTFHMGSPRAEKGRDTNEEWREVRIDKLYWIGRTEVTRGQYRRIMGALPKDAAEGSDELPVDHVSWIDAQEFCKRLSQEDGRRYRLPTEAEWEFACRAGTSSSVAGTTQLEDMAWFNGNSGLHLHPVGTRQPNHWGLLDMQGNVSEWALENYIAYPANNSVPATTTSESLHAVRGGSAFDNTDNCRSAIRRPLFADLRKNGIGFRVVCDQGGVLHGR